MNKVWVALVASAVSSAAFGQSAVLYQPARVIQDQGITVKSWGSGTIAETDEVAYQGTHSIRVSTRNFFQGGLVNFGTPIDLSQDFLTKTNLLRIMFKVADSGPISGGGGPGGKFPGGGPSAGNAGGGGAPPGIGRGGGGPGRGPGGPPPGVGGQKGGGGGTPGLNFGGGQGKGPGAAASGEKPVLKTMRLIVTTTDGKRSEAYVPANTNSASDQGWLSIAVPLQAITGLDLTNKTIKSIAFAGNTTSTFFIGDVRVVNDSTPIQGEPNTTEINAALGDTYELTASGFGGSSILKYNWDFDDRDGIQVDAEGQSVKHKFSKAGTFNVTLTIADYYGLKPAYTKTIKVTVNP